jgi:alkanesulfonate monooxygenase SsuD/methylene tetrahydromethanopterin reductase-like flavin-dependent oxidoreductase (luciferase family)
VYNAFLAWSGYEEVAERIREGWAAKDRDKTTSALDDQLVDDIAIIGSQEECQDRIRAYAEGGITTHIISCVSGKDAQATYQAFTGNQFKF